MMHVERGCWCVWGAVRAAQLAARRSILLVMHVGVPVAVCARGCCGSMHAGLCSSDHRLLAGLLTSTSMAGRHRGGCSRRCHWCGCGRRRRCRLPILQQL